MNERHSYRLHLEWTGNEGAGTSSVRAYQRDHLVSGGGKRPIEGSSDPAFRGDATRWNPEELLVASLAQCHMLWYLHLAADAGIVVQAYADTPEGVMVQDAADDGGGQFERVKLYPQVTVASADMVAKAQALHDDVPALCFISRSVSFPVEHVPSATVARVHL
jgi:organic hydroperoxide reductase OsmC/OhrA